VKTWLGFAAYGAVVLGGWALHATGHDPKLSTGWLLGVGFVLTTIGTYSVEKARDVWSETGWSFAAVENLMFAGIGYFLGLGLLVLGALGGFRP
jgi:hypothetical protein